VCVCVCVCVRVRESVLSQRSILIAPNVMQFPRTHRMAGGAVKNVGWEITSKLAYYLRSKSSGRIAIINNVRANRLIQELDSDGNARVIGIEAQGTSPVCVGHAVQLHHIAIASLRLVVCFVLAFRMHLFEICMVMW
jgi:hypothetical protein